MADHKVDIFNLLDKVSRGDKNVWNSYSPEEQKTISPLIIMRWLSGTSSARQIVYLNVLVNHLVFTLGKHPDLLMKLMACCTDKRPSRYQWIGQKKGESGKKRTIEVIQQFYNYSAREAKTVIHLLSKDDIISKAEALGWEKEEITKLKKEL